MTGQPQFAWAGKKVFRRLLRGLLVIPFLILLLIISVQLPPVQKLITKKLSHYLTEITGGKVNIDRIYISLTGDIKVRNLDLCDPEGHCFLQLSDLRFDLPLKILLYREFTLGSIAMEGLSVDLYERQNEYNFQYLIDSFASGDENHSGDPFEIRLADFSLGNSEISIQDDQGSHLQAHIEEFTIKNGSFSLASNEIYAGKTSLSHAEIRLITAFDSLQNNSSSPKVEQAGQYYSGFDVRLDNLSLLNNRFELHQQAYRQPQYFEPRHLNMDSLSLVISNFQWLKDSLVGTLEQAKGVLPGFTLSDAKAQVTMGSHDMKLEDIYVATPLSSVSGDFQVKFSQWPNNMAALTQTEVGTEIDGRLDPRDILYFFPQINDSLSRWGPVDLQWQSTYNRGILRLQQFTVQSTGGKLSLRADLHDLKPDETPWWNSITLDAELKPPATALISSFIPGGRLPPELSLQASSSGKISEASVKGYLSSDWGNVQLMGSAGWVHNRLVLDIQAKGHDLQSNLVWGIDEMGSVDFDLRAQGNIGDHSEVQVKGALGRLTIWEQTVKDIEITADYSDDQLLAEVCINDPDFSSHITTQLWIDDRLKASAQIELQRFNAGKFLKTPDPLLLTGNMRSELTSQAIQKQGTLVLSNFEISDSLNIYQFDSLKLVADITPDSNYLRLDSDDFTGSYQSNFDFTDLKSTIKEHLFQFIPGDSIKFRNYEKNTFQFDFALQKPDPLQWAGIDLKGLSGFNFRGALTPRTEANKGALELALQTDHLDMSGWQLDDINLKLTADGDNALIDLFIASLAYDSTKIGTLSYQMLGQQQSMLTSLSFRNDSLVVLDMNGSATRHAQGFSLVIDSLKVLNRDITVSPQHSIFLNRDNISLSQLEISNDNFKGLIEADLEHLEFSWVNADLTQLQKFGPQSPLKDIEGLLSGKVQYRRAVDSLNLNLAVSDFSYKNTPETELTITASRHQNEIPFQMKLSSESNSMDLRGIYSSFPQKSLSASLQADVGELGHFQYLFEPHLDKLGGSLRGSASISGTLTDPEVQGDFFFERVSLGIPNPKLALHIEDQQVLFRDSEVIFNNFTVQDEFKNSLQINGKINPGLGQSLSYQLNFRSDNFVLFNSPAEPNSPLYGQLMVAADLKVGGKDRNVAIAGGLKVKDSTNVTYVTAGEDITLTTGAGIVKFVDPQANLDTINLEAPSLYDSLIAGLPDFNLETQLSIEREASFKMIIDPKSGDFIELSGDADLEFDSDGTQDIRLSGIYHLRRGTYQLSFYDIVSKEFTLSPGSTVTWDGDPQNGKLNILAIHNIKTSSVGLVENEIAENEKDQYRKPLNYLVGIRIEGSIESPEISFTLDLPQEERGNYPVLANKLDRINQPEFEGELNRQVFGLLVLGGFLPTNVSSEINTGVMATTALANSVNSILANQLNQITRQYVKGVDIDIGLQSYSDFTTGGGQTRTAMEFRVSKTLANDRLSIEAGGSLDLDSDQTGAGGSGYKGDIAIIYDLTPTGNKKVKLFNNETYDIIYHEVRNTGISLIFIREFDKRRKKK